MDATELKKPHKEDKEKKKNKSTKDVLRNIENSTGDAVDNVGKKKKKKRERHNKDDPSDVDNTEDAASEKEPQGAKIDHKADNERKTRKTIKTNRDGDMEKGTEAVVRKKRKSKKERDKEINCTEEQVTNGEAKLDSLENDSAAKKTVDNKNNRKETFGIFGEDQDDGSDKVERKKKKKKHRRKSDEGDLSSPNQESISENLEGKILSNHNDGPELKRKKKHKKKDLVDNDNDGLMHSDEKKKKIRDGEDKQDRKRKHKAAKLAENGSGEGQDSEGSANKKRKKIKQADNVPDDIQDNEVTPATKGKKKKSGLAENDPNDSMANKSNKKVTFSGNVEVFCLPNDLNTEEGNEDGDTLVRGKRFTPEEDELVKGAVHNYILQHDLGEEGLDMVLNSSKHRKLKGCWKEIGSAIPYRPYGAVYHRAQVLFRRSDSRKWTEEEYNEVMKYQEMHGNKWKPLADELGKHRWHVKDTWRRLKLANLKKGHWSQNEYQTLFDLVNLDLQLKVSEEKKSKHGMLRDNICWTAISDKLSTRSQATCCIKWYKQLTSPMVAQGLWADVDDYRLLGELYSLDATCIEDVEWDDILDNRSGYICRKRWNQMATHIGQYGNKSFSEQVEVLAQRYCPLLLEAREAWDSKPRVP